MLDREQRNALETLLTAVRSRPTNLPIQELAEVRAAGLQVEIDRTESGDVVFATRQRDTRLLRLSAREQEVALLAASGYSNQQIATALFVSLATVKDHMHSCLSKTELSSRGQLIAAWYGGLQEVDHD